jgi:acetolactate synthase I/II/III large subunit
MSNDKPIQWVEQQAAEVGDSVVGAMMEGGVDHLFFTSGGEIGFYQEAIAKAEAQGRKTIRLITVPHEHVSLNAALGFAAVSGRPAVTAAHVDVGTQHYGGAVHTAWRTGLPVIITAGAPPTAYPGSIRGARDAAHLWNQQTFDQNGILRQYTKWDHRLEYQDNPGLIVSRAIQVARSEPCGPVYLSFPQEVSLQSMNGTRYPSAAQLGIARAPAPDPDGLREVAEKMVGARNPVIIAHCSGRNPATVPALVELAELLGCAVAQGFHGGYLSFPKTHPLFQRELNLREADAVLVFDADVPWLPGSGNDPTGNAYVATVSVDAIRGRIPTYEFTANLRLTADPLLTMRALTEEARKLIDASAKRRIAERSERWAATSRAAWQKIEQDALQRATKTPIDPLWLSYQVGQMIDDNCIVFEELLGGNRIGQYLRNSRPGSLFSQPGSSGGWSPGAALGAKLAAPDRDVIAVCGDGFYMFSTPAPALWAGLHHKAPFMVVIYQNRSYTTGTLGVAGKFPDSFAQKAGFPGGYFDPPIDFAKEAEAAGAYGENVRDPAEVAPALQRGLKEIRNGRPAVISVWLPRLAQKD